MLSYEQYIEKHWATIRQEYEDMLYDVWYPSRLLDEVDDWRNEYKENEYDLYKKNFINENTNNN